MRSSIYHGFILMMSSLLNDIVFNLVFIFQNEEKVEMLFSQKCSSVLTLEKTESRGVKCFYENQNTEHKAIILCK